ncbi:MAG: hypothetical protein A2008_12150 [Candidatus Wallbacteria bacterium GWC2_49_35]|uniref:DUF1844 domain-containing protein n=1 Tax=Candidatus Wallbacteria bacterium GWC2_49_35 TaxID=1817813 RepID=A0A1F7X0Z6_9BACT|nr:MAG: hypothetical protein A2008_12150 [Candidatus Wallbacteria bacterium GWC2_49_35]HBC75941.1 hypothetical protein [Candidatus Wallbacteria bacterium]
MSENIDTANAGSSAQKDHQHDHQNAEQVMAQIDAYSIALSFTMMLGQKAWICLGKVAADPKSGEVKVDLPQAQFSIDCMAAILDKLRGKINDREANEVQTMITNLRLNYVSTVNESEKK